MTRIELCLSSFQSIQVAAKSMQFKIIAINSVPHTVIHKHSWDRQHLIGDACVPLVAKFIFNGRFLFCIREQCTDAIRVI